MLPRRDLGRKAFPGAVWEATHDCDRQANP